MELLLALLQPKLGQAQRLRLHVADDSLLLADGAAQRRKLGFDLRWARAGGRRGGGGGTGDGLGKGQLGALQTGATKGLRHSGQRAAGARTDSFSSLL